MISANEMTIRFSSLSVKVTSPVAPHFLAAFFLAVLFVAVPRVEAAEASPLKICLLSASAEYDSDKSLAEFQSYLESHYQIVCLRAFGKDKGDNLPNLDSLGT